MDDTPPPPRIGPPRGPAPPPEQIGIAATIGSFVALGVGAVVTAGLLLVGAGLSLCSTFGETCTEAEQRQIDLALLGAVATFLGVPLLVAAARRDARWLLAPVVEAAVVVVVTVLYAVF